MNKRKLLVVEDDLDVREAIIDALYDVDAEFITADNGLDALNKLKINDIIAIMSDINMPKMNGLEFLSEVRKLNLDTPFVVLSAYGDKSNTVKALRMGAMDFLDKPFDIKILNETINKALELGVLIKKLELDMQEAVKKQNAESIKLFEAKKQILKMRFENKKAS